ncbi:hypothetical protein D3C81_2081640 [compost metagenome]
MIVHLGKRVKAVVSQHDLITSLTQEYLGGSTDSAAIVDHHDFHIRIIQRYCHDSSR